MKITQNSVDKLNAKLMVQVTAEDYKEKVESVIENYRRTAIIPGFRK